MNIFRASFNGCFVRTQFESLIPISDLEAFKLKLARQDIFNFVSVSASQLLSPALLCSVYQICFVLFLHICTLWISISRSRQASEYLRHCASGTLPNTSSSRSYTAEELKWVSSIAALEVNEVVVRGLRGWPPSKPFLSLSL